MYRTARCFTLLLTLIAIASPARADGEVATYRGLAPVVHFDVSPPLRDIPPAPPAANFGRHLPDPPSFPWGELGPQDADPLVQDSVVWGDGPGIPGPSASFDGPPNVFGVAPPDPVGDVGPDHYVAMSNLSFAVYDKTGGLLLGPAANNTLWAGFGGDCETDNDGDPVVLYDQLADRWLLSQFTASGPTFFNCVALSTSPDPTGSYFRWAFSTGSNFPDYPKYAMWPNAYFISTRELGAGIGAYAVNRAQMLAGNPSPQVISFLLTAAGAGGMFNIGDGVLPADLDGFTPPPADNPHYWLGSMDDGGPYGAPQDALNVWHFNVDFATPANSTMTLEDTLPIAPYDTIFPCSPSSRNCIPQPDTTNKIDILSYRQRPMWRLAYRNFGDHASMVTNQSVEAGSAIAGIRWWEVRVTGGVTSLFQEGTYAPGLSDGIHRWMGSIAMDSAGNMGLAYSASDETSTYPSVWYTGRLSSDPVGMMPQGEQAIVDGTGSQTGGGGRWGDYTSTNVDPVDDCIFWHVNEWVPTTSSSGWVLRIGAFRFNECGTPDFTLSVSPASRSICAGSDADYTVGVGSVAGFTDPVTLSAAGNPAPTTTGFDVNPVIPPGGSTMTVGNTAAAPAGTHTITVTGNSTTGPKDRDVDLEVFTGVPGTATLSLPADGAVDVPPRPVFTWSAVPDAATYSIEIASDPAFGTIVDSATGLTSPTYQPPASLPLATTLYWHVQAENVCGAGAFSGTFSFTTLDATEFRLFVGLDDATLNAYRMEPSSSASLEAFTGVEVWGAAYDPVGDRVFFSDGTVLWVWPVTGTPTMLGTVTDSLATSVSMEGLAYYDGTLYASRVAATGEGEGIYTVDPDTLGASRVIAFLNPAQTTISGIDADPDTGQLYGVNDSTALRGLVKIDPDGTVTVVTDYAAGETDVDGLAIGGGNAYLITDDANDDWAVYNFAAGTYVGTVTSPYTTTEVFAAGAWIGPTAAIFSDGFESGDTSQWTLTVP